MKIPIMKLKGILLTSIPEELTDEDAITFQGDLLHQVNRYEARGVVLDISSLQIVDSFMARVINETANMVGLLGAEIILCGMNPSVAMTLVEMGRELINVKTALNVEQGFEIILALIQDEDMKGVS